MKNTKALLSIVMVVMVLVTQIGAVLAAPAERKTITGAVTSLLCETDQETGEYTVLVTLQTSNGTSQTVHIDAETAESLGLLELTGDGDPDCTPEALANAVGLEVAIDSSEIITDEDGSQHPVGAALATFFSDITTYAAIMDAHEDGVGFGGIAQALWLTKKLEGDNNMFVAILLAKKTGDYSAFTYEDGTPVPQNWGQFKKLILEGDKKNGLGVVMSNKGQEHGNNGGENGHGNGNAVGNGITDKSHNNDMGKHGNNENKGNGKHR